MDIEQSWLLSAKENPGPANGIERRFRPLGESTCMMMLEKTSERVRGELLVERTGISFHDLAGDRVRISVVVHNAGEQRSAPTPMRLESAPLGAFVPWRPLAQLVVPALQPGESRELSAEVKRPRPTPLGNFNRIPPKKLITAVNSPDQPSSQPGVGIMGLLNFLRRGQQPGGLSGKDLSGGSSLAPDLWDLLSRGQPHWAGNINVFVGARAVERHLARALRVYPGRTNLAMFLVGGPGRHEGYAFELVGLDSDWKAALHDVRNNRSLTIAPQDVPIQESEWVESDGGLVVMLATYPPAGCETGNLEVHVTRRSTGKTAIVEFGLDPRAQGTGCYFV
jgi:hypothetical protein